MLPYILVICLGLTAEGCAEERRATFVSRAMCLSALETMHIRRAEDSPAVVAWCEPEQR